MAGAVGGVVAVEDPTPLPAQFPDAERARHEVLVFLPLVLVRSFPAVTAHQVLFLRLAALCVGHPRALMVGHVVSGRSGDSELSTVLEPKWLRTTTTAIIRSIRIISCISSIRIIRNIRVIRILIRIIISIICTICILCILINIISKRIIVAATHPASEKDSPMPLIKIAFGFASEALRCATYWEVTGK